MQKFVEDYIYFEYGNLYDNGLFNVNYNGYYGEHYGISGNYGYKKGFIWVVNANSYDSYILGSQKAFIKQNKIFLGKYTGQKYESLGIELEILNLSYILTFRIKLYDYIMYNIKTRERNDILKEWILSVQPQTDATIDFEKMATAIPLALDGGLR